MPSKAQGLSLNTIVIAAIVLVVLVILVGLTTGYFGKWVPKFGLISATSCAESGGSAVSKSSDCSVRQKEGKGFYEDISEGQKCCLPKDCGESVSGMATYCASQCEDSILEARDMKGCSGSKICCIRK